MEKIIVDVPTLIVTIITGVLAYLTSSVYISLELLPWYLPPYSLSLSVSLVLIAAIYTRNFVPTFLVSIASVLGMSPTSNHGNLALIEIYLLSLLLTVMFLSWMISTLRLISVWNSILTILFFIFGIWTVWFAYLVRSEDYQQRYWRNGIAGGFGGNGGFIESDFPLIDASFFIIFAILALFIYFRYRNQLALSSHKAKQARIFGIFLIILSQIVTIITLLWAVPISRDTMLDISSIAGVRALEDLFTRVELYPIVLSPMNVVLHALVSTGLTTTGIMVYNVGKKGGTISGSKGGPEVVFLAAPIFTMLFMIFGNYTIQSIVYPGGFFIPGEVFVTYFTAIWSYMTFAQIIAWIPLAILAYLSKE